MVTSTGSPVAGQRGLEEVPGGGEVSPLGDIDVDDLVVLVYCSVHDAPDPGALDVGFVDEPAVTTPRDDMVAPRR